MKINIPNHSRDLQNDNIYTAGSNNSVSRMTKDTSNVSVDISASEKEVSVFGIQELKSVADVRAKASVKDVSLESNALAVMSNSMSGEDFAKLTKDGFSAADMTPEQTVTVVDKIKATLAASGVEIPGYTDNLSSAEIERITGSKAAALAIESALTENQLPVSRENVESISDVAKLSEKVTAPTDDAKKYMVGNDLEPTINNFYMANHSSSDLNVGTRVGYYVDSTGYVGKNALDADISELKPQIERIITESGFELNDKTLNEAQWLLEKDLPLTKDNLQRLSDINTVIFPIDVKTIADSCAAAISDGKNAQSANLLNTESYVTKAGKLINEIEDALVVSSMDDLASRRLLEETRLHLTIEASVSLLKKGIEIDTSDLQKLVEELKQAEKEAYAPFLMEKPADDMKNASSKNVKSYDDELELKLDLFRQTSLSVEEIKSAPIEFVGNIANDLSDGKAVTLDDISKNASSLKAEYERAGKSYETMMTAPRYDLGDSIKKAFRNVDDILEDMDLEVNRLNEKAVRILGYSGMEINDENIENALKAEVAVENLIANMTPAKVLQMIRDGENPLYSDIFELSEKITNKDEQKDNAKYSEFLYRLEKSGDITDEEKTAYIGIFRMINKIEKSDGKLVSDVLKSDEKLTLANLISAARSDKQIGTDVKIDDSFGTLEKLVTYGESITDQILNGFRNRDKDDDYEKQQAKEIREMITKEEAVLKSLDNISEPQSPINMAAMDALINSRGSMYKSLRDKLSDDDKEELEDKMAELREGLNDEDSAEKAIKSFAKDAKSLLKKAEQRADKYIDVNSMKLINKQLTIVSKMAEQRTYEVPVNIAGELTSINLKIVSDSDNAGKVSASFETETTGKVSAEFTLRNGEVTGYIVTENSYFEGVAKEKEQAYRSELEKADVNVSSIYYTSKRSLSIKGNYEEKADRTTPATSNLYSVAKAIIKAVSE